MSTRTRTIASFFTVATAAMLLGAAVTSQAPRPPVALADPAPAVESRAPRGPVTFDSFRDIVRRQNAAVVNINTRKVVKRTRDPFRELFGDDTVDRFLGPRGDDRSATERSLGSGFIVDPEGYVLTNRHVVEGADEINVTLANRKRYAARLVGKDARTDVALLKIEPKEKLTAVTLGDSDRVEVGEWAMAIGNPFGLGGNSVTVGVISYKGRDFTLGTRNTTVDMIQTDASINPGNSGGPLIDARGEVIGINTLIITQGLPQSAGVGFAVPINMAKEILPQLRDKGKVVRGWLGVSIQAVTEDLGKTLKMDEPRGALVSDVTAGAPAEKAGVRPGDVVLRVDDREIVDSGDLSGYISSLSPGKRVTLHLLRDGEKTSLDVVLGTFPEEGEESGDQPSGASLGMSIQELTPSLAERLGIPRATRGVVVTGVEGVGAAEEAGLLRGDVILTVNGKAVEDVPSFERAIAGARVDGAARLRVRRGSGHLFLVLHLD